MNGVKVLLCDLETGSGLGQAIQGILETDPDHKFIIQHEVLGASEHPVFIRRANKFCSKFCPAISILLCGATPPLGVDELMKALRADRADRPVLVVAETTDPATVAKLFRQGATDVLIAPLRAIDLIPRVWRSIEAKCEEDESIHDLKERLGLQRFIGESPALIAQIRQIPAIVRCNASVLITGETGTGKELIAKAIHNFSPRRKQRLVTVHCAALSPTLLESELFGHEKGAFTGAHERRIGRFEQAQGGTLFLDEIGEIDATIQVKLLRFLGEKTFERVGSNQTLTSDVRLVAATNVDLEGAVRSGRFRRDLFYRLNVMRLNLPPLRERGTDILLLSGHFLGKFKAARAEPVGTFTPAALLKLSHHDWPGNVRELESVIERAVALATHPNIQALDVDLPEVRHTHGTSSFRQVKLAAIDQFEAKWLAELLLAHRGNISQAARAAKLDRHNLRRLVQKHGILVAGRDPPTAHPLRSD